MTNNHHSSLESRHVVWRTSLVYKIFLWLEKFPPFRECGFSQKVHEARRLNVYPTCPKCARNARDTREKCSSRVQSLTDDVWTPKLVLSISNSFEKKEKEGRKFRISFRRTRHESIEYFDEQATRKSRRFSEKTGINRLYLLFS